MTDAFIEFLKSQALKAIAGLSGIKAILAKLLLKFVLDNLEKIITYFKQKKIEFDELEKYKEIINNSNTTPEERNNANRDFLK